MFTPNRLLLIPILAFIAVFAISACDNSSDAEPTATPALSATVAAPVPLATSTLASPAPTAAPQPEPSPTLSALAVEIDTYLHGQVEQRAFSGSVLVAREGEVLLSRGYGMADAEAGTPNTPGTRFHLASVSKAFAAMVIMILQEQGKLSVDDPLCKFVADCPEAWQPVTLHHLLTHTSGLPGDATEIDFALFNPSYIEALAIIRDLPLLAEPGKSYSYSNVGYIALGYVVEQASGQTYEAFLRDNIFAPLGMTNSGVAGEEDASEGMAAGYSEPGVRTGFVVRPVIYAAGGVYSTVEDLYKWDQALYTEKLVKQESLDRIFAPNLSGYGYGWEIAPDGVFGVQISHSGHIGGFRTRLVRYPTTRSTIIVLSNNEQSPVESIASELARLAFK